MMKTLVSSLLAAYFLIFFSSIASAQNSQLTGLVKDKTNAVVPAAAVTLTNVDTGAILNAKTSKVGFYVFASIVPGRYSLSGEAPGFARTVVKDVKIDAAANVSQDIVLQVQTSSQSVNVESDPPSELTETTAAVSTVIDRPLIENMPLNGNSLSTLFELTPGVVTNAGGGAASGGGISVDGQRPTTNNLMIDGASANIYISPGYGNPGVTGAGIPVSASGGTNGLLPVDAVEEFRMQTSSYDAQYGRTPGGQIEVKTRGGTNAFHGSLFENFRNQVMDGQDWFNAYYNAFYGENLKQSPLRMNDFGGTFGGPILKNRLFFFVAHESLLMDQPQTLQPYDVPDQQTRVGAAAVFQPFLAAYPSGNGGPDNNNTGSDFYLFQHSNTIRDHSTSGRLDAELPRNMHAFFRINDAPSLSNTPYPTYGNVTDINILTVTSGVSWRISSTILNDITANYSTYDTLGYNPSSAQSYVQAVSKSVNPSTISVGFYGSNWPGLVANALNAAPSALHQFNLVDSLAVVFGRHTIKMGADYRRASPNVSLKSGLFLYSGQSSIQNGMLDEADYNSHGSGAHININNASLFSSDDWRVNTHLTLNLGLRWEFDPTPHASKGPGLLAMQGEPNDPAGIGIAPSGTSIYKTRYDKFAPRLGFAYDLHDGAQYDTVLRGGGGIFFDAGQSAAALQAVQLAYPYATSGSVYNISYSTLNINNIQTAAQSLPQFQLYLIDPNLTAPRTYNWSLTVDQKLGEKMSLSTSYVGNSAHDLLKENVFKGLSPALTRSYGYLYVYTNGENSSYNALQMQFRNRATKRLNVLASYTFAHALDNGSSDFNSVAGYQKNYRANSDNDIRHIFASAIHYGPQGFDNTRFLKALTDGWSVDSVVLLQSAAPFSVFSSNPVLDPNRYDPYADVVPGVPLYISGSQCAAEISFRCPGGKGLNPAAFVAAPGTRDGTSARNGYRAFGLTQFDLAFSRSWPLSERAIMSFRVDAFDILNHPSFANIDNYVGDVRFGQAGATYAGNFGSTSATSGSLNQVFSNGGARSLQLNLKVRF